MKLPRDLADQAYRYERKFFLERVDLQEVERLVRTHPAFFLEVFPPRRVNNLYLDTPGRRGYFDHVNGVGRRCKWRIRWYGQPPGRVERSVLEIKAKEGLVGRKRRYALAPFDLDRDLDPAALVEGFGDRELFLRLQLRCSVPSLVNQYRRRYYLSADGAFRLTVDDELSFGTLSRGFEADTHRRLARQTIIVELKYHAEDDDRARAVCTAFPFRISRSSKYCYGVELLQRLGVYESSGAPASPPATFSARPKAAPSEQRRDASACGDPGSHPTDLPPPVPAARAGEP